ncbi:MAG TPA: trypsin-like peptidase domain-containing protein [Candidatus Dormibacteraeota bacterium]|jgi:S1-C subfamily serine protease|nr:trypsin-like peptidase domain-containing protein [Candidatus Dormibacteraeota bacterium]
MATLSDLSREIAELVGRLGPSIVRVDARQGRPATGIIWADNLVLTADHVLEHEDAIQVTGSQTAVKAAVAGRDPGTDLALLRTEGLKGAPAPRGRSTDIRPGHLVIALGQPGDLQVTFGIVSGLSGSFRSWRGGQVEHLIQTTAELLPGFSGGPLVDVDGRVIGINSWNFGRGISRAVPVETAERVAESLKTHGRIRRAYLGLGAQPVRLSQALASQVGQESGLLIVTVEAGGPAQTAGLLQGDTIVTIDGDPVRQLDELFGKLAALEVGSAHRLGVVRAGDRKDIAITVGERQS